MNLISYFNEFLNFNSYEYMAFRIRIIAAAASSLQDFAAPSLLQFCSRIKVGAGIKVQIQFFFVQYRFLQFIPDIDKL